VAERDGQAPAHPGFPDLELQQGELLAAAQDALREFDPQPGMLGDLPQITVDAADVASVCRLAKDDPRLALPQLLCLSCVDYSEHMELVYILHSLSPERLLCVKARVSCDDPRLPSVTGIWRAAEWYEREAHDLVLARSVARMPVLAEFMLPLARVGGQCVAMKGSSARQELKESARAIGLLGGRVNRVESLQLPGVAQTHHLVILDKVAATPCAWPRQPGNPARQPL